MVRFADALDTLLDFTQNLEKVMDAIALARSHMWSALEGFHCPQLTQICRISRSLCTIHLQIPSLMPLEMRKVQLCKHCT